MKKSLRKKRLRHYIKIFSLIFLAFLVVAGAYTVITYNHTRDILAREAGEKAAGLSRNVLRALDDNQRFVSLQDKYHYVLESSEDNLDFVYDSGKNTEVAISKNGETLVKTENIIRVHFADKNSGRDEKGQLLNFNSFKKSMTDGEYEKIRASLTSSPSEEGQRCELLCTEYYGDGRAIYPKSVSLAVSSGKNSVKELERFELDPKIDKDNDLFESGDKLRNIIPTDFVLGEYKNRGFFELLEENGLDLSSSPIEFRAEPFTYIYYSRDTIDKVYAMFEQRTDSDIYEIRCAEKYNVLDRCIHNIIAAAWILFGFFLIIGLMLAHLSWRAIQTELEQEQIRLEITNAMAHDLKTPLFVISGFAENLRENVNSDKRAHYADKIIEQTAKMNSLVHNMLDYSRFERYDLELRRTRFTVNELSENILLSYPPERVSLKSEAEVWVNADRNLLETAIHNLIDNAFQHGAAEGEINIAFRDGCLTIENPTSAPLSDEDLKTIWKPYAKLDASRTGGGNGLGLAITKRILDLHGYRYSVNSENGKIKFSLFF